MDENGKDDHDHECLYQCDLEMVQEIDTRVILHWNYRNLQEIPAEVFEHGTHLKELYLKRNNIHRLPADLGILVNLRNLYLIGNQLRSLPPEIGQLRSLKVLDLSQNGLSELPASMGDLCELEQLLLTQNRIQTLPPGMKRLKNLTYLEISGNLVRELPESLIQGLVSLRELAMDQNPICRIPRSVSNLSCLRYISVCNANLSFLPALPFHALQRLSLCGDGKDLPSATVGSRTSVPQFRFDGNPKLNYLPFWIPQFLGPEIECFGCGIMGDSTSWDTESEGTTGFSDRLSMSECAGIQLCFKGKPHTLRFDEDLCEISRSSTKEPCSLLELCLRQVYVYKEMSGTASSNSAFSQSSILPTKYLSQMRNEYDLSNVPSNLTRLLTTGPVAQCFQCFQPIFTQAWPLVFGLPEGNPNHEQNYNQLGYLADRDNPPTSLGLSTIFLCSSKCSSKANDEGTCFSAKSTFPDLNFITENKLNW